MSDQKKHRSPPYPAIGLEHAIALAEPLTAVAIRHPAPLDAIASTWGHQRTSGAFAQRISALKQFGLLTDEGNKEDRKAKLTSLALDILHSDKESPAYAAAVRKAALSPKLYEDLWAHYDGSIPESDLTISHYLIRDLAFNPTITKDAVAVFRDTLAFAKVGDMDKMDEEGDCISDSNGATVNAVLPQSAGAVSVVRDFPIPLISGGVAVVKVPVPMSEADFAQLTGTLAAWKAALVRKSDDTDE